MKTLSKTAAIKTASRAISITRSAWNWRVIGPFRDDGITRHQHHRERTARDYWDARIQRTRWVAQLALHLMGRDPHGEYFYIAVYKHCESSVHGIVDTALRLEDQASEVRAA